MAQRQTLSRELHGLMMGCSPRIATKAGHEARCHVPGIYQVACLASFDDLVDAVCDQPVRLAVDAHGRVRGWSVDEAERFMVLLVDPILEVRDAVCVLLGLVRFVGIGNVRRGGTIRERLVDVNEKRQGHISCV